MNDSFVYKWTDTPTSKMYIGCHKGTVDDGYVCSSKIMLEEYRKRPEDFVREVLSFGTYKEMRAYEMNLLLEVNAASNPDYYNRHNADWKFCQNGPLSEETRQKLSKVRKGNKNCVGRKLSDETKRKISRAKKGKSGRPHTTDFIEKQRERMLGNKLFLGRKHRPETLEKMKQSQKQRFVKKEVLNG